MHVNTGKRLASFSIAASLIFNVDLKSASSLSETDLMIHKQYVPGL